MGSPGVVSAELFPRKVLNWSKGCDEQTSPFRRGALRQALGLRCTRQHVTHRKPAVKVRTSVRNCTNAGANLLTARLRAPIPATGDSGAASATPFNSLRWLKRGATACHVASIGSNIAYHSNDTSRERSEGAGEPVRTQHVAEPNPENVCNKAREGGRATHLDHPKNLRPKGHGFPIHNGWTCLGPFLQKLLFLLLAAALASFSATSRGPRSFLPWLTCQPVHAATARSDAREASQQKRVVKGEFSVSTSAAAFSQQPMATSTQTWSKNAGRSDSPGNAQESKKLKNRTKQQREKALGTSGSAALASDTQLNQAQAKSPVEDKILESRKEDGRQSTRVTSFASLTQKELHLPEEQVQNPEEEASRKWNEWLPRRVDAQRLGLKLGLPSPNLPTRELSPSSIQYTFDLLMERHPNAYILMLMALCMVLVVVGGVLFQTFRSAKRPLGEDMWSAWGNLVSAREHLRESTPEGRTIGFILTLGGLFCYSILTSTITARIKTRMEWLREGTQSQVMERGHVVIGGVNHHLPTLLSQLSKSHEYAVRDGTARSRKQVVVLLAEQPRKETEKVVGFLAKKDLPHITLLIRSGSLTSTGSFKRVAADNALSVILLSSKNDYYDADADAVASVMALLSVIRDKQLKTESQGQQPEVIVEVSKATTGRLLHTLSDLQVSAVEDLSAKLFVQCCRQPGLVDVYARLLDHNNEVINLRNYPTLAGLAYGDARRGFKEAVICGMVRDGKVNFHPSEEEKLLAGDKLLVIAEKLTHREPSHELELKAATVRSQSAPAPAAALGRGPQHRAVALGRKKQGEEATRTAKQLFKTEETPTAERILIVGWRLGVPEMIREYNDYVGPGSEIVVLAPESVEEREELMCRQVTSPLSNVRVVHKVGNPMSRSDIRSSIFDKNSLFHHKMGYREGGLLFEKVPFSISVISSRFWRSGDNSKPDKQSLYSLLLADSICRDEHIKINSLSAEFQDKRLAKEVLSVHPRVQYVATSDLMGLVTSQVAEHHELNAVWLELLNSWGDEIYVKDINFYKALHEDLTFDELAERALTRKEVAIGYRKDKNVVLNPCPKDEPLNLSEDDSLIVIAEF